MTGLLRTGLQQKHKKTKPDIAHKQHQLDSFPSKSGNVVIAVQITDDNPLHSQPYDRDVQRPFMALCGISGVVDIPPGENHARSKKNDNCTG